MKLSKYFTFEELTVSDYAKRYNIDNSPNILVFEQLKETAKKLDVVRDILACPIIVTSGYRSPKVNTGIGSSLKSQHQKGEAVDFKTKDYTPREIIKKIIKSGIEFDQLILEYDSWVHISFKDDGNRKQVLIIDAKGTRSFN